MNRSTPSLLCILVLSVLALSSRHAGADTKLQQHASATVATVTKGSIVTAEQTGDGAPSFAGAGKLEPTGVPPEKVIYEIGSISKVFTGMLLAKAVLDKKVTLETTVRELMGSKQAFADEKVASITLLQLATHTSGLPRLPHDLMDARTDPLDPYAHYDRDSLNASVATTKINGKPPFKSSYSNFGIGLLGDLLARQQGKPWEELVRQQIAEPLGMVDTCVTLTEEQQKRFAPAYMGTQRVKPWAIDGLAGAGALRSTAADMLRFGVALARPDSSPLKEVIAMIEQPQGSHGIGLALMIQEKKDGITYWHNGGTGGFRSWLSAKPKSGEVTVLLTNNSSIAPEEVIAGKLPKKPAPPDPALADYVGDYDTQVNARGTTIYYRFEARGAGLWMEITGQPMIPLERHPEKADRFMFKPVKAEIQFTREAGKVTSATLYQSGLEIHAKKEPAAKEEATQ